MTAPKPPKRVIGYLHANGTLHWAKLDAKEE
jgi:hypothetical protein